MSEKTPLASFDEVRALLAELPGPDWTASAAAAVAASWSGPGSSARTARTSSKLANGRSSLMVSPRSVPG